MAWWQTFRDQKRTLKRQLEFVRHETSKVRREYVYMRMDGASCHYRKCCLHGPKPSIQFLWFNSHGVPTKESWESYQHTNWVSLWWFEIQQEQILMSKDYYLQASKGNCNSPTTNNQQLCMYVISDDFRQGLWICSKKSSSSILSTFYEGPRVTVYQS